MLSEDVLALLHYQLSSQILRLYFLSLPEQILWSLSELCKELNVHGDWDYCQIRVGLFNFQHNVLLYLNFIHFWMRSSLGLLELGGISNLSFLNFAEVEMRKSHWVFCEANLKVAANSVKILRKTACFGHGFYSVDQSTVNHLVIGETIVVKQVLTKAELCKVASHRLLEHGLDRVFVAVEEVHEHLTLDHRVHGLNVSFVEVVDVGHNTEQLPHGSWLVEPMLVLEVDEHFLKLGLQVVRHFCAPGSIAFALKVKQVG